MHAHNVVLQLTLSGGVICGLFALAMFLQQIGISWTGTYRLAALISFFVVFTSITENPVFDHIPGTQTAMWRFALYWPVLDDGSLDPQELPDPGSPPGD